jgi:hypothetical protein
MKRSKIVKNAKKKLKQVEEFVFEDTNGRGFFVKNTSEGPWLYRFNINTLQWVTLRAIAGEVELDFFKKQRVEPTKEEFYHQLHKQYSPKF